MPGSDRRSQCKIARRPRPSRLGELLRGLGLSLVLVMLAAQGVAAEKTGDTIGEIHEYYIWRDNEDLLEVARADELGLIELMVANP